MRRIGTYPVVHHDFVFGCGKLAEEACSTSQQATCHIGRIFNHCTSSNYTNLLGRPVLAGGAAVVAGGAAVDDNGYGCEACCERISLHKRLPASEIEKSAALHSFLAFITSAHYAAIYLLDNQSTQRCLQARVVGGEQQQQNEKTCRAIVRHGIPR